MSARKFSLLLFAILVWMEAVLASDTAKFNLKESFEINTYHDTFEWERLSKQDRISEEPVCNNNVTTQYLRFNTLIIDFQPKNQNGILGISLCRDETREDCYVVEIFGLISGRLGYFLRKHARNETGEELWVPGKDTKVPSTLLKSDVLAKKGTWDPEGQTLYRFYVQLKKGKEVAIRYDGGIAKQQKEMTFQVPESEYAFSTTASYYNDSQVEVVAAKGCPIYKRTILEPGQSMEVRWYEPIGDMGIAICTDSGQNECYVLEQAIERSEYSFTINYFWREHSLLKEDGEEGWVPGLETTIKGVVLKQGNVTVPSRPPGPKIKHRIVIEITRFSDEELVRVSAHSIQVDNYIGYETQSTIYTLTLDLPNNFQFTKFRNRAIVDGKKEIRGDLSLLGPCFTGMGLITPLCKQQLSKDIVNSEDRYFYGYSPSLGRAETNLMSEVLESKAARKTMCIYLKAMIGPKGGKITLTARDASNSTNETVQIGQLTYNNIFPLNYQEVRRSAELPPALQNVPLIVNLKAERPTAESLVLLEEIKLCSYDGCGVPTADGTPFIALGKKTDPAKFPWHVGIFRKENQSDFVHICGGTLVRPDVVVSAAHCFVDPKDGKVMDIRLFKLAAGKKFNSLFVFEPNQQLSNALDIYIAPRYQGEITNFVHDIALVLVKFTTSTKVLPACLDWHGNNASGLKPGDVGQVAGWGLNDANTQTEELHFAKLPYVSYEECIKTVPKSFVVFVTHDKLCAGNVNGSTVKQGDSGGGLAFENGGLWYLRGVVSTGVPGELTYSTFTEVSQFLPWIKKTLNITS